MTKDVPAYTVVAGNPAPGDQAIAAGVSRRWCGENEALSAPSISEGSVASPISAAPLSAPVIVNPLKQPQWDAQLGEHSEATLFHGTAWARVLRDTYGHQPVYFCRYSGEQLRQVLPDDGSFQRVDRAPRGFVAVC